MDLLETPGAVIDTVPLGEFNVVYKRDATYLMQFVGGQNVFRFDLRFPTSGILAANCAIEYRGFHYVIANGDVVRHNGHSIESIIDDRNRNALFAAIDSTNYQRAFVTLHPDREEVWFCIPETGETACTKAWIYSVRDNQWSTKALPDLAHAMHGPVDDGGAANTWSATTETWSSISGAWDARTYNPATTGLLLGSPTSTRLYQQATERLTTARCSRRTPRPAPL